MNIKSDFKKKILFKISENNKNIFLFFIFAFLSIAVMIIIFLFSNQSAMDSSALSAYLSKILFGAISPEVDPESLDFNFLHTFLRKLAHFTLFSTLGFFLASAAINQKNQKLFKKFVITSLIGLIYCISDEIHQLFIPERSGEISDVLIDFSGIICGTFVSWSCYKVICLISKKNKKIAHQDLIYPAY